MNLKPYLNIQAFNPLDLDLDLASSHDVDLPGSIADMAVMRETGLVVVRAGGSLYQFSLQEGHLIKERIKRPCEHGYPYLLCLQISGRAYLALSCWKCRDIKLMNLNKQLSADSLIEYEVITAFKGKWLEYMCHGEENRIFIQSRDDIVLELDTSTTAFKQVRRIKTGHSYSLCYVPDPHRLIVVSDGNEVCAVSCDNNKVVWKTRSSDRLLYLPSHDAVLVYERNAVVVLNPETGSEIKSISLPDTARRLDALCLFNNQIIVGGSAGGGHILYFDIK